MVAIEIFGLLIFDVVLLIKFIFFFFEPKQTLYRASYITSLPKAFCLCKLLLILIIIYSTWKEHIFNMWSKFVAFHLGKPSHEVDFSVCLSGYVVSFKWFLI